jgi:hypothetical protein
VTFGISTLGWRGVILIVYNFIKESVHVDDNLDISLDGFFKYVRFWLIDRIGLFIVRVNKLRISG